MEREGGTRDGEGLRGSFVRQGSQQRQNVGREPSSSSFGSDGREQRQQQPRRPSFPSPRHSPSGHMTAPQNNVPVSPRISPRASVSSPTMGYHPGDFPQLPRSSAAPTASTVVPSTNPNSAPHRRSPAPLKTALKTSNSSSSNRRAQQQQQPQQSQEVTQQQLPTSMTTDPRVHSSPEGSMRGNVFQASNRSSDPAFPYQSGGGFDSGRGTAVTGNSNSGWLQALKFSSNSYQRSRSSGNTVDEEEEAEADDQFDENAGFGFGTNTRQLAPQSSYRPSSFSRQLLQRPTLQEQLQGTAPGGGQRAARRSSKDQDVVSEGNSTITSVEDDVEGAGEGGSGDVPHHPFHHPYGESPYPQQNRDEVESIGKTTITTVSEVEIRPVYGDSFSTSDGGADGSSNRGSNANSNSSYRRQRRLEEILQGKNRKSSSPKDGENNQDRHRRGSGGLFSAPSQDDDDDGRLTYNQTLPDTEVFQAERRPSEIVEEDFADQHTDVDESVDPTARPEDMQPAPMIMQAPPPAASSGASVGTDPAAITPAPIEVETPTLIISPQDEGYARPDDIYNSFGGGAVTNIVFFRSSAATAAILDGGGGKGGGGGGGFGGGDYERRPSAAGGSHSSQLYSYSCRVDRSQDDKAMEIPLNSFARPHMRAFHLAWISFFVAFFAWFAVTPLLGEIKDSLGFTKREIWTSNISAVAGSAVFRVLVGPLCDRYGARWVMGCTLLISAVPVVTTGLIRTAQGLATVRLFVGIAGSSFVTTEYWTSTMFTREVAGTANALVAGWGNLGGGVTQIVMGSALFPLFRYFYRNAASPSTEEDDDAVNDDILFGLDGVEAENTVQDTEDDIDIASERAWRTVFVIPAIMCIVVAHMVIRHADDCPKGNYDSLRQMGQLVEISPTVAFKTAIRNRNVWILFIQYGTCFGVELTMSNAAALYFIEVYGQPTESAAAIASIFGWLNLFARGLGGFWGDMANARGGMRGRLWWQTILFALEGLSVMAFAHTDSLASTIVVMTVFSLFVQASEGSTYGIVPYVDPAITGSVAGIVAAGGNVGGTALGLIFREVNYRDAFFWTGVAILASSILSAWISIDGHNRMFSCCERSDGSSSRGRIPPTQPASLAHASDAPGGDILGGGYVGDSTPDGAILGGGYVGTGAPVVGASHVARATPDGDIEVTARDPRNTSSSQHGSSRAAGEGDAASLPSIPHVQTAPQAHTHHPNAPTTTTATPSYYSNASKPNPGRNLSESGLSV